jgi:hypothetical protein
MGLVFVRPPEGRDDQTLADAEAERTDVLERMAQPYEAAARPGRARRPSVARNPRNVPRGQGAISRRSEEK